MVATSAEILSLWHCVRRRCVFLLTTTEPAAVIATSSQTSTVGAASIQATVVGAASLGVFVGCEGCEGKESIDQ